MTGVARASASVTLCKGAAADQPQSSGEIKAFTPLNCFKLAPSAD